jgi:uncharacterized membrane protein
VVWLPILATLAILHFIVELLDQTISLLPDAYQPEQLFGFHIPGLGVVLSLLLLIFTGILATNFLGQRLVVWSESVLDKIPLVRSIYNASKQVIEAIFATNSQAFRKVLMVEYPRKGMWAIAFQTGLANAVVNQQVDTEMVSIFIPTTPNPTSGFLMMVPKGDVIELSMSIDEALKFIISLGMMQPNDPTAFIAKNQ